MQIKNAMILAAGYGKRLLPITEKVPKPLIKIGQKNLSKVNDYNSHNTYRLDVKEMIGLLQKLDFISDMSSGNFEIPDGV